jgi:hypothetical protein
MKENQRESDSDRQGQQRKPKVETFDPFAERLKPSRRFDHFGEMFEEKIINDDF